MSKKVLVMNNPMEESRAFPLIMKYSTPAYTPLSIIKSLILDGKHCILNILREISFDTR